MLRTGLLFVKFLENGDALPYQLFELLFNMGKFCGDAIECEQQEENQNEVLKFIRKINFKKWNELKQLGNIKNEKFDYDEDYIFCEDE